MLRPGSNKDVCLIWGQGCSGGSGEQGKTHLEVSILFSAFSVDNVEWSDFFPHKIQVVSQPTSTNSQFYSGPAHCLLCPTLTAKLRTGIRQLWTPKISVLLNNNWAAITDMKSRAFLFKCVANCLKTFRSSSNFEPGDEKNWSDRDRDWFERFDSSEGWQGRDGRNSQSQTGKRSFMKELQECGGKGRDNRDSAEIVRHVTDGRDKGSREKWGGNRSQIKDPTGEELHYGKRTFSLSQLTAQRKNCN